MVAAATGWPLDRVSRYADPPLGERVYVAERAQNTYVHLTKGGATLLEVIRATLGEDPAEWDSFNLNGHWIVTATIEDEVAQWTYEPQGNTVNPINATAKVWMGIKPSASDERVESTPDASDTIIIENEPVRLVAVPALENDSDVPVSHEEVAPRDLTTESEEQILPLEISPSSKKPAAKKAKRGRAKVPSWDEILFGGPKSSD